MGLTEILHIVVGAAAVLFAVIAYIGKIFGVYVGNNFVLCLFMFVMIGLPAVLIIGVAEGNAVLQIVVAAIAVVLIILSWIKLIKS